MDSVLVDPASPDQLHSNFSQAANGAAQAIKNFTLMVEDSRTKEVMDKAKESRAKTVESITGWKVTEHEDWLNLKQADGNDDVDKDEEGTAEAGDGPSAENVNTMLDKLRSSHAGIEVSLDEDSRTVTVSYPHSFARVTLRRASSIYLRQLKLTSKFSSIPPLEAITVTVLTAKTTQNFTGWFLRKLEHGLDQTIWLISSYV